VGIGKFTCFHDFGPGKDHHAKRHFLDTRSLDKSIEITYKQDDVSQLKSSDLDLGQNAN
jgi:hypothetical protein